MSRSATPPQPPPLFPPRPNTPTPPQPLLPSQSLDSLGRDKARLDDKEMSLPAHKALKGISQKHLVVANRGHQLSLTVSVGMFQKVIGVIVIELVGDMMTIRVDQECFIDKTSIWPPQGICLWVCKREIP